MIKRFFSSQTTRIISQAQRKAFFDFHESEANALKNIADEEFMNKLEKGERKINSLENIQKNYETLDKVKPGSW